MGDAMKKGQYSDRMVRYVDHLRMVHEGVIVGQDKTWAYVQSTREGVRPSPQGWHFRVKLETVKGILI